VGRPLIYLDANVVIRLVEGDATTRAPLAARLAPSLGLPGSLVTSRLTRLECRSKPLRAGDLATLAQFDVFFSGVELLLVEVSAAVVERATGLRARYNLKTPHALHNATAVEVGAAVFLTGDRTLSRCSEVPVEVL
jgi:predicted nucleic acid-binding protein